jgi:hypothetical protein
MRRAISVLVVVGLALAVVLLWANRGGDPTPGTEAQVTTTTSSPATTTLPADSTTLAPTTTSSPTEIEVVETVEQAEAILSELWFGWFEGIYNEDEDRIREVVATEHQVAAGINAFGSEFVAAPTPEGIILETEILRSDAMCLVVWGRIDVSAFRGPSSVSESVQVLRNVDGAWRLAFSWRFRDDLWEADCESEL